MAPLLPPPMCWRDSLTPVLAAGTLNLGMAILAEATLSFQSVNLLGDWLRDALNPKLG